MGVKSSTFCRARLTANRSTGFLADGPKCDILHLGVCVLSAMLASASYRHMTHRKHRNNCSVSSALLPCAGGRGAADREWLRRRVQIKTRAGILAGMVTVW